MFYAFNIYLDLPTCFYALRVFYTLHLGSFSFCLKYNLEFLLVCSAALLLGSLCLCEDDLILLSEIIFI